MTLTGTYYNPDTHPDQKYFLTEQSEEMLTQIQPELAEVVRRAVAISDIEMQVLHGRRTLKQQDEFLNGGSQSIRNGSGYEGRGMRPHSHAESFAN